MGGTINFAANTKKRIFTSNI
uniref:Uncharacterized protein n=1 Tax=Rhizophora mucronata TaxID=61149 RepID=A0A2P2N9D0_RHIMU